MEQTDRDVGSDEQHGEKRERRLSVRLNTADTLLNWKISTLHFMYGFLSHLPNIQKEQMTRGKGSPVTTEGREATFRMILQVFKDNSCPPPLYLSLVCSDFYKMD